MKRHKPCADDPALFEYSPQGAPLVRELKIETGNHPVWTENKAKLIARYLHYFVLITKHGTYIDAFAGPQEPDRPDLWAAKLVLDYEPCWLKDLHLIELNSRKVRQLELLKANQPLLDSRGKRIRRRIEVHHGDSNAVLTALLESRAFPEKKATFCLLDQRTFECNWETVRKLAAYKPQGSPKIELFYFYGVGWLHRSIKAVKDETILQRWWGRDDWDRLRDLKGPVIREMLELRLRDELGYRHVKSWPIYRRSTGGGIMYFMVHATDDPKAPVAMARAYRKLHLPTEKLENLKLEFDL